MTVTQIIILFTLSYHTWQKSNKLLLAIYGTVKFFYEDTPHSPASYAHTTHTGLEMMLRAVASLGKFPCFIFYCLRSKRYSTGRFLSLLASTFVSSTVKLFLSQCGTFLLQCNYLFSQHS
jgi:hypothetical protein